MANEVNSTRAASLTNTIAVFLKQFTVIKVKLLATNDKTYNINH